MNDPYSFDDFFWHATGHEPYPWQHRVAKEGLPPLLDVPTGMGKTEGIALAWAWRHLIERDEPRHLAYCLPMRVLVQQTAERLRRCFANLFERGVLKREVPLFVLMGGTIEEGWETHPELPWVLVGTQDQLLSRALNRGYGMSSYWWPVHFGLLNNDCRWVIDEIQLMGPGLWTSAQLDWMRQKRFKSLLPCPTTWMSATLGTDFLATSDRKKDNSDAVEPFRMDWNLPKGASIELHERWKRLSRARRPVEILNRPTGNKAPLLAEWLACQVLKRHEPGSLSLVVCNTVRRAQEIFEAVGEANVTPNKDGHPRTILLTSRFRPRDRRAAENELIEFEERRRSSASGRVSEDLGLICVSTQVVEAGVDISARRLWSESAPWPAIIQRLGRLNRDGFETDPQALFWPADPPPKGSDRSGPYAKSDLDRAEVLLSEFAKLCATRTAREALSALAAGTLKEEYECALAPAEWPYPRAFDVHGLFGTEPDVHGGFTDVSHFVRGSDPQADVTVFWRDWAGRSPPRGDDLDGPPFDPEEGCPVAAWRLARFLNDAESRFAWIWNEDRAAWNRVKPADVRPGMALMLRRDVGGYDDARGWTGQDSNRLKDVPAPGPGHAYEDNSRTETGYWSLLASHLADVRLEADSIVNTLGLGKDFRTPVVEAARWHDLGKAHPLWQGALPGRAPDEPLAKCPRVLRVETTPEHVDRIAREVEQRLENAQRLPDENVQRDQALRLRWALRQKLGRAQLEQIREISGVRRAAHRAFRPGLRHEAASALAMWARYRAGSPEWPALAVYLVAAHHGKVRTVLRARGDEGQDICGVPNDSAPLVFGGKIWPLDFTCASDGAGGEWGEAGFRITEPGWTALVIDLLGPWGPDEPWDTLTVPISEPRALGPFALAYLEALVRAADWRASDSPSKATYPAKPQRD